MFSAASDTMRGRGGSICREYRDILPTFIISILYRIGALAFAIYLYRIGDK